MRIGIKNVDNTYDACEKNIIGIHDYRYDTREMKRFGIKDAHCKYDTVVYLTNNVN